MKLDKSPLCESLGVTPTLQLLSFFIAHQSFDYSKTELAKYSKLSRQTVYKALDPLLKYNLVVKSRKIANTTLYKLDINSQPVDTIQKFNSSIVDIIVRNESKGKIKEGGDIQDVINELQSG